MGTKEEQSTIFFFNSDDQFPKFDEITDKSISNVGLYDRTYKRSHVSSALFSIILTVLQSKYKYYKEHSNKENDKRSKKKMHVMDR